MTKNEVFWICNWWCWLQPPSALKLLYLGAASASVPIDLDAASAWRPPTSACPRRRSRRGLGAATSDLGAGLGADLGTRGIRAASARATSAAFFSCFNFFL